MRKSEMRLTSIPYPGGVEGLIIRKRGNELGLAFGWDGCVRDLFFVPLSALEGLRDDLPEVYTDDDLDHWQEPVRAHDEEV
jgi:hypothetical protein